MRAVLILIIVVLFMVFVGWVTIQTNRSNQATITINTEKIDEDTRGAVQKSGEIVESAGEKIQKTIQREENSAERKSGVPETGPHHN